MADIQSSGVRMATPTGTANIYRLKVPQVNEQAIRKLARQFGMQADTPFGTFSSNSEKLMYVEQHLELTIHRSSGAIRLIDRSRWQIDDRKTDLQMEDGEAQRLALRLTRKQGLLPAATDRKLLKVSRLRVGTATREGLQVSERTIDVAVALQRLVDKIPVDGPGGKIVTYIDQQQQLSGIEMIWRELGAVYRRNQAHRPPESAIEEMNEHFRSKRGVIQIEQVRYGYFEEDRNESQQYLQPAYIIFGLLLSSEGGGRKRTIYVAPALARPVGIFTPPLVQKPRQRLRPEAR